MNNDSLDLIYEIQTEDGELLIKEIAAIDSILNANILDHDGSLRY